MKTEHKNHCGKTKRVYQCSSCRKVHGNDDECPLIPQMIKKFYNFPKLMVVSGAIAFLDKELCVKCYDLTHVCDVHFRDCKENSFVNWLCLLRERKNHGTFHREYVTEDGIFPEDTKIHQPYRTYPSDQTNDLPKLINFGKKKKDRTKNLILKITPKTAMDFLLKEILLNSDFSNCVAVIEQHLMKFVIESLVHFNLELPKDLNVKSVIDLSITNFKFVTVDSFLADHCKFANLKQSIFFPMILNRREFYHYRGSEKPDLSYFLCLNDSFENKEDKENYYRSIQAWDFEHEMKIFLGEKCLHLMISIVKLADMTAKLQKCLQDSYRDHEKPTGSIFRCFNSNHFFYNLMVYWITSKFSIYSLKDGETGIYQSNCRQSFKKSTK